MKSLFDNPEIGKQVHHKMPTESVMAAQTKLAGQENSLALRVGQNNLQDMHAIVSATVDLAGEKALNDYERSLCASAKQYSDDPDAFQKNVTELTNEAVANPVLQDKAYRIRRIQQQALGEYLPFINENRRNKLLSDLTNSIKAKIGNDLDKINFLYANTPASPQNANDSLGLKSGNAEVLIADTLTNIGKHANATIPGLDTSIFSATEKMLLDQWVNDRLACSVLTKDFADGDLGGKLKILNSIKIGRGEVTMFKTLGPGSENFSYSIAQMSQAARSNIFEDLKKKLVDSLTEKYLKGFPNEYFKNITDGNVPLAPTRPLQQEAFEAAFNDIFQKELAVMLAEGNATPIPGGDLGKFIDLMDVAQNFIKKTSYVPRAVGEFSEAIKGRGAPGLFTAYIRRFNLLVFTESTWDGKVNVWGESEQLSKNLGKLFMCSNLMEGGNDVNLIYELYQASDDLPIATFEKRQNDFEKTWSDAGRRNGRLGGATMKKPFTYLEKHMDILMKKWDEVPEGFKDEFKELAKFYYCQTGDYTSSIQAADFYLFHFGKWGMTESVNMGKGLQISRYGPNVFYGTMGTIKDKVNSYCKEMFEKNIPAGTPKPFGYFLIPDQQTYDEIDSGSTSPSYLVMASYPMYDKKFTPADAVDFRIGADLLGNKNVDAYEESYKKRREAEKAKYDYINTLNFHD